MDLEATQEKMAYQDLRDLPVRKETMEIVAHLALQVQEDSRFEKQIKKSEKMIIILIIKFAFRVSQELQVI